MRIHVYAMSYIGLRQIAPRVSAGTIESDVSIPLTLSDFV
jgi:hypothetical protein